MSTSLPTPQTSLPPFSLAAFFYDIQLAEEKALHALEAEMEAEPHLASSLCLPWLFGPPSAGKAGVRLVGLAIRRFPRRRPELWAAVWTEPQGPFRRGALLAGGGLRLFREAARLAEGTGGEAYRDCCWEPWRAEEDPFPARLALHSLLLGSAPGPEEIPRELSQAVFQEVEDLLAEERRLLRRHLRHTGGRGFGYLLARLARLSGEEAAEVLEESSEEQASSLRAQELLELLRHPSPTVRLAAIAVSGRRRAREEAEGEGRGAVRGEAPFLLPFRRPARGLSAPLERAGARLLASERMIPLPWPERQVPNIR